VCCIGRPGTNDAQKRVDNSSSFLFVSCPPPEREKMTRSQTHNNQGERERERDAISSWILHATSQFPPHRQPKSFDLFPAPKKSFFFVFSFFLLFKIKAPKSCEPKNLKEEEEMMMMTGPNQQ
jgi:hypothetical protein